MGKVTNIVIMSGNIKKSQQGDIKARAFQVAQEENYEKHKRQINRQQYLNECHRMNDEKKSEMANIKLTEKLSNLAMVNELYEKENRQIHEEKQKKINAQKEMKEYIQSQIL